MPSTLANDPAARIFHTLLVAYLAWTCFELALVPFVAVRKATVVLIQFCLVLTLIVSLHLVRKGLNRPGGFVYLCGSGVLNIIALVFGGGLHSPVVAIYTLLPISAAWLLGYRAMVWATAVFLGSSLIMTVLQLNGIGPWNYFPTPPFAAWLVTVEAVVVGVVPVAQMLKILKERLVQSEADRAALQESEERFRNLADTAPVMIWASGPDKLCTFFSKVWLEFTGRTTEQELGNGWAEGVHPDDVGRCIGIYTEAFDAHQRFRMEYRLRRADGEYRWIMDEGVPRLTQDGSLAGYIGSCVDITEVKRAQELESMARLARGVAHDFNNLLGGILANAELALSDETNAYSEELANIRTTAIRGAEIVRQLMIYTGQEQGTVWESIDLSRVVDEMLQLLRVSISKRAILKTDLGRELPAVYVNPPQIRQIVMNLVINASEAIGEREGTIQVTTAQVKVDRDERRYPTSTLVAGDYVRLEVSDTGIGMTPEVQTRIFDPFFTTKWTGHGLGLSAVQGVVRSHFGAVNVVSSLGKGTRFEILLPCTDQRSIRSPNVAATRSMTVGWPVPGQVGDRV